MSRFKTAKVDDVIKILKDVKDAFGNIDVFISTDSEGNSYGTIDKEHSLGWDEKHKFVIFYPYEENIDYEEFMEEYND